MPAKRLREYLDQNGVKYVAISHSPAYTAQEIAAAAHVPGQDLAKTVLLWLDEQLVMAVLPATRKIVLDDLRAARGANTVRVATEEEFKQRFPDCEVGAMPPFGNLYGLEIWVAQALTGDAHIAFTAGTHSEVIKMTYADFARLAQPRIASFST